MRSGHSNCRSQIQCLLQPIYTVNVQPHPVAYVFPFILQNGGYCWASYGDRIMILGNSILQLFARDCRWDCHPFAPRRLSTVLTGSHARLLQNLLLPQASKKKILSLRWRRQRRCFQEAVERAIRGVPSSGQECDSFAYWDI